MSKYIRMFGGSRAWSVGVRVIRRIVRFSVLDAVRSGAAKPGAGAQLDTRPPNSCLDSDRLTRRVSLANAQPLTPETVDIRH
jgi:hypothetical protein